MRRETIRRYRRRTELRPAISELVWREQANMGGGK